MPHELTISQKNCRFQVLSFLILCNDNESFLNQIVICNKKSILYNNQWLPSQWLDWEEAAKHFPKPNSHTHTHTHTYRKDHGHCCVVWYQSHLLQLSESLQIHYIWKVCSANQWNAPKPTMPAAGIGPQKGSNSFLWQHLTTRRMTNASNVEGIGLQSFASSAIFTCPFTNWLPLPQAAQQLLQGKFNSQ